MYILFDSPPSHLLRLLRTVVLFFLSYGLRGGRGESLIKAG